MKIVRVIQVGDAIAASIKMNLPIEDNDPYFEVNIIDDTGISSPYINPKLTLNELIELKEDGAVLLNIKIEDGEISLFLDNKSFDKQEEFKSAVHELCKRHMLFGLRRLDTVVQYLMLCEQFGYHDILSYQEQIITDLKDKQRAEVISARLPGGEVDIDNLIIPEFVESASMLFSSITANKVELKNFDFSRILDTKRMFNGAIIDTLDLTGCDFRNVIDASSMFEDAKIKHMIGLETCRFEALMDASWMFSGAITDVVNLNLEPMGEFADARSMFATANIGKVILQGYSRAESLVTEQMFESTLIGELNLDGMDLTLFDADGGAMFENAHIELLSLTDGCLGEIETPDFEEQFCGCYIEQLLLSRTKVYKQEDSNMFRGATIDTLILNDLRNYADELRGNLGEEPKGEEELLVNTIVLLQSATIRNIVAMDEKSEKLKECLTFNKQTEHIKIKIGQTAKRRYRDENNNC